MNEFKKQKQVLKRSRGGCITCKRSKKKCDETKPYCLNCTKRKRKCEGYHQKFIFEDDPLRASLRRRGFGSKNKSKSSESLSGTSKGESPCYNNGDLQFFNTMNYTESENKAIHNFYEDTRKDITPYETSRKMASTDLVSVAVDNVDCFCTNQMQMPYLGPDRIFSPVFLDTAEMYFLDLYKNKFALEYPFFRGYENPFYKSVLPVVYENSDVRCAVSVLGGSSLYNKMNQNMSLEYNKKRKCLLSIIKAYFEHGLQNISQDGLIILSFIMMVALLLEKNTHVYNKNLEAHLQSMRLIFLELKKSVIYSNELALLAFKVFIYNDIMSSLINNRQPLITGLVDHEEAVSAYPFVKLVIALQSFKADFMRSKHPNTSRFRTILREKVKNIQAVDAIGWFPSFSSMGDDSFGTSLASDLSEIYKMHLLFHLEDEGSAKKAIASEILSYIVKLPYNFNLEIAVLPQVRSIIEYLDDTEMSLFTRKMGKFPTLQYVLKEIS